MELHSDNKTAARRLLTFRRKEYSTLFISVWLAISALGANGQKIDSLRALLPKTAELERANLLYELAYEYVDVDDTLASQYARDAFEMAITYRDSLLFVKAGRVRALALARLHRNDSSIALSLKILPVARRNNCDHELKHILNRLGSGYSHKGKFDSALIYNFESLAMRERIGDPFEISVALNNIGTVYYNLADLDKALSFYHRSLEYKEKIDNKYDLDVLLLNISLCYSLKKQVSTASKFVERVSSLCGNNCSKVVLMMLRFNQGLISYELNNFMEAEIQFSKSYLLSKELANIRFQLDNLVYLIDIARRGSTFRSHTGLLNDAETLLEDKIYYRPSSIRLSHQLLEAFGQLQDSRKVSTYQSKYIQLKDSMFTETMTTNLMKVEADYMERENKAKLKAQESILMLSHDIIDRQRTLNIVAGIVVALSTALVVVLIQNVKRKKRANGLLEQKIKERTIELELNHNLLLKSFHERDVQFQKMSTEIKSSLATIKGLGVLVAHDLNTHSGSSYLAKIEETSNNLIQGLSRVHDQQF
jgi:tetratricopeptide (TPR) repeat protein